MNKKVICWPIMCLVLIAAIIVLVIMRQSTQYQLDQTRLELIRIQSQLDQTKKDKDNTLGESQLYLVARVIDGDTIVLENGIEIRYIGINTPEKGKPFYKEATNANRKLVEGKWIRLEYDIERIERTNEWKQKRYGEPRTLAYVYVDGIFVNAWMIEKGFAKVKTVKPNVKYQKLFEGLEREARKSKKGLWK